MASKEKPKVGLILSGGGARGAYQAGALKAVIEITNEMGIENPFSVISGCSAGAINGGFLASEADDLVNGSEALVQVWNNLTTDQVIRADLSGLIKGSSRMLLEVLSGGLFHSAQGQGLLETTPLGNLIARTVRIDRVPKMVDEGYIDSCAITAVNYADGSSNTFFYSKPKDLQWVRTRRRGIRTALTGKHILASSSLPILFPPVKLGAYYFGDGSLRNHTPLSPAVRLGADKVLVVGVRRGEKEIFEKSTYAPSPGRVLSILLNSILLDSIDMDCERCQRINDTLDHVRDHRKMSLRPIQLCVIRPSQDLGKIASEEATHVPRFLRYLIRGLGSYEQASDLISYLLFERAFTERLTRMGYWDVLAQKEEIHAFFSS